MVLLSELLLGLLFFRALFATRVDVNPTSPPIKHQHCDNATIVTQAYLVNNTEASFYCNCKGNCTWFVDGGGGDDFRTRIEACRSSNCTVPSEDVSMQVNGWCVYCTDGVTRKNTLFNVTVDNARPMSFTNVSEVNCTESSEPGSSQRTCMLPQKTFKYIDSCYHSTDNLKQNLTCEVDPTAGYPPFKTIKWNLLSQMYPSESPAVNDLDPCIIPSKNYQVLTFIIDPVLIAVASNWNPFHEVQCIVSNGIGTLIGQKCLQLSTPTDDVKKWFNSQPLAYQTTGTVSVSPGKTVNITCASSAQYRTGNRYRLCPVSYPRLNATYRCMREAIVLTREECCADYPCIPADGLKWNFTEHKNQLNEYDYAVFSVQPQWNVYLQCQVDSALSGTWQSVGDPVKIQLEETLSAASNTTPDANATPDANTTPDSPNYEVPLLASSVSLLLIVLCQSLLILGLFCKLLSLARKKGSRSTSSNGASESLTALSSGAINVRGTNLSVNGASGPGLRRREVGQEPNILIASQVPDLSPQTEETVFHERYSPQLHINAMHDLASRGSVDGEESIARRLSDQDRSGRSCDQPSHAVSSPSRLLIPRGFSQAIRDGSPNRSSPRSASNPNNSPMEYLVLPRADGESPREPSMELNEQRKHVEQKTTDIINALDVDALFLASLVTDGLVTETQRQMLHSKLDSHRPQIEVNSYFLNVVVLNWPLVLFDQNLVKFCEVLRNHSSPGNQSLGETLTV